MFNPQGVGTHDHIIGPRLTDQQIIELVDAYPELEERFKTLMESPNTPGMRTAAFGYNGHRC